MLIICSSASTDENRFARTSLSEEESRLLSMFVTNSTSPEQQSGHTRVDPQPEICQMNFRQLYTLLGQYPVFWKNCTQCLHWFYHSVDVLGVLSGYTNCGFLVDKKFGGKFGY